MKAIKLATLLTTLIMTAACGNQGKTSPSFNIVMGAAVTGTPQWGGVLITGRRIGTNTDMQMAFLPGEATSIELPNGLWEFAAIGWEGDPAIPAVSERLFTGNHHCAYAPPVDLQGGDVQINLSLSSANCTAMLPTGESINDPLYMQTSEPDQFRKLHLRSCLSLPTTASSATCTNIMPSERGLTGSFRVEFGFNQGNPEYFKSLSSKCFDIDMQDDMGETAYLKIPAGNALGSIFTARIHAYTDTGCSGDEVLYKLNEGLYNGKNGNNKRLKTDLYLGSPLSSDGIFVFFEHNPSTQSLSLNSLFGFGSWGPKSIVTNETTTASDYARITGINTTNTRLITVTSTANFAPHDEFLWIVNEEGSTVGCGAGFVPGIYSGNRIKHIVDATTLELYEPINHYPLQGGSIDVLPLPNNLAAATNTADYCSVQMVRVANYSMILMNAPAVNVTYSPIPYNKTNGTGGILAVKAKLGIVSTSSGAFYNALSADETGREGGTAFAYAPCPTNKRCAYFGNGSGDGRGGGIVMVTARELELDSGDLKITANGHSTGTIYGGDGGSVIIRTDEVEVSSGRTLFLSANGGSAMTTGGDGGYVFNNYCGSNLENNGTITPSVTGGVASAPGATGNLTTDSSFCPF